jgi:hypothetical protein
MLPGYSVYVANCLGKKGNWVEGNELYRKGTLDQTFDQNDLRDAVNRIGEIREHLDADIQAELDKRISGMPAVSQ